eukprot:CAMPEP_0197886436 /NCGR_PEP_ID=MMETSP1439-20131203/16403_1 /TAXON_ID=66791 /ORGANISM="Gonyaulax spinifera, Strain CCMP409" /LENGTH=37 /DNA_ID= /DNA_START= /DNA_END= /DNA_ORIENTATION=
MADGDTGLRGLQRASQLRVHGGTRQLLLVFEVGPGQD